MARLISKSVVFCWFAGIFAIGCGPTTSGGGTRNTNGDGGPVLCTADEDNDGICDQYEGRSQGVDTDGDGTPDYLDLDSDNDGIADSVEGGVSTGLPPVDSDGDGTPDFRDLDSDNNGIPDSSEGTGDTDMDTIPNFADLDDDGDGIIDVGEIGPDPSHPLDSDGDGTPDFRDTDSDNDFISDLHETGRDSDEDGIPDYLDLDSDNDQIPDEIEAGDTDLVTHPVDTDNDGLADFRDPDSDNDGLPDGQEDTNFNGIVDPGESDPRNEDTDGDGVPDLIEVAAGTDPQDNGDNPQAHGDFYFLVPYEEPTDPTQDTLEFRTSVQFADLYFLLDETGSMTTEFSTLSNPSTGIPAIIDNLTCVSTGLPCAIDSDCGTDEICFNLQCIQDPLLGAGCVPDLWTGVGFFNNCNTYDNIVHLQGDPSVTANAINISSFPGSAEAVLQSAKCVADPSNCSTPDCSSDPSVTNPIGCPGYRPDAVRILIHITDAGDQASDPCGGVSSPADTGNALQAAGIKYVGIYGTSDNGGSPCDTAAACTREIGIAAGTVDQNNQPFTYDAFDAAVATATAQAVLELVRGVPLYVTIEATDLPDDDGDALRFIDYLEVNISGQGNCTNVSPTEDTDNDTHDDAFPSLLGGTPVCWDVHPVPVNDFEEPATTPKVFKARLTVLGDGSPLDARDVYFLVPPEIEGPIPR